MMGGDGCGAVSVMSGKGHRNIRRKPAPLKLCPPQIPHDRIQARTRATAVESRRLTGLDMAPPLVQYVLFSYSEVKLKRHSLFSK
jgi:hypothetical protein